MGRGPSPRGRGNRLGVGRGGVVKGSIPAWAGKPTGSSFHSPGKSVHPRVGGETAPRIPVSDTDSGPSPRGRGNHQSGGRSPCACRSIPAWAGKPRHSLHLHSLCWVHPRVGGETVFILTVLLLEKGPSPRGRGNRSARRRRSSYLRSIPAWAGKPLRPAPCAPGRRVHPRVGGETDALTAAVEFASGPSPRGRGNLGCRQSRVLGMGSIPAWAGKPCCRWVRQRDVGVHPRVGGETRG